MSQRSGFNLSDFKALTFDCYGTLIDWETGLLAVLGPWRDRHGLAASDEELLAAYGREESRAEHETPGALYPDILRQVHRRLAAGFSVAASEEEPDRLATSVGDWPAFADSPEALRALQKTYQLVIFSNVDRASFARSQKRLGVSFDAIFTAQDMGTYKPDLRFFEQALAGLEAMGIGRGEVVHVAQSLYHDHVPAKRLGLKTVWVDRRAGRQGSGATPPAPEVQPDLTVGNLAELAAIVRR